MDSEPRWIARTSRPSSRSHPEKTASRRLIHTEQLFQDKNNTVRIAHEGKLYLLRITRENKLILTK